MNPNHYRFAVDDNGLTIVYSPLYAPKEHLEEFFKYSRNTGAYVGFAASDVIRTNPEYAVRIPASNCWLVLVPHWHKNYIIKTDSDETLMIMLDGSGRGMILQDGTTTMRLVALEANIHYDMTPGTETWNSLYSYRHDNDDGDYDDFYTKRAIEEFDLWTSKKRNTEQTVEERNKVHLELAIAAFKHATNAATRGTPLPHLMQRIHDAIMEGPPEWRDIFDDARKYFAPK